MTLKYRYDKDSFSFIFILSPSISFYPHRKENLLKVFLLLLQSLVFIPSLLVGHKTTHRRFVSSFIFISPTMSRSLSHAKQPKCVLDRNIINTETIGDLQDIGQSFFASLCGRNRGVFVLDPPDGNTWGCVKFPPNFAEIAGVEVREDVILKDSNAIKEQFVGGNITASDTVELLDYFTQAVYSTSADTQETPYGCDVGGLAELQCDSRNPSILSDGAPIRSVTLAGVFVSAPWATNGKTISIEEAAKSYTAEDFQEMKKVGLNTVQIPVYTSAFESGHESTLEALTSVLKLVKAAGLNAIIELKTEGGENSLQTVSGAAEFAMGKKSVIAIILPSMDENLVSQARVMAPDLPLFLPGNLGHLSNLQAKDENVFFALGMPHTTTVGDVASSTSEDDRMKLFYHEAISCISRSPIEYSNCFKKMPIYVSGGFDLAIDDCVNEGNDGFKSYGQCDRFNETTYSGWWERHRKSFAARQVFAYERGLGWNFATWKLLGNDDEDSSDFIDTPAKLLALKNVAAAGLMPSLDGEDDSLSLACLNPPESDFTLGDATLSPTPGPPPDCDPGWWNATTEVCDYWIPPPTPAPCNATSFEIATAGANAKELSLAAIGGALAATILGSIILKLRGGDQGYQRLP